MFDNLKNGWYWVRTYSGADWQVAWIWEDRQNEFVFSLNGEDGIWSVNELFELGPLIPIPN